MANEVQGRGPGTGRTCYFLIRNSTGSIWNGSAFETYLTANYTTYDVAMSEQGTASNYYVGTFPTTISPGVYSVEAKQQAGGSPAETDATWGQETYQWNGSATAPLSSTATSGQVAEIGPVRLTRGVMVSNFPIYMKSAFDHVTPLTSGTISGQIARDGGSFGVLQSGAFAETGNGFYNLSALTSGDLTANTVKLLFTGVGMSGGLADPLPMSLILQRSSGQ